VSHDQTPVDMLLKWERERPDAPWLFQPRGGEWQTISWREAADQVRRMASAFKSMNLPPKSAIAISGRNCAHWFLADLAIAMAGHISVGLYPKQADSAVRYILKHCDARAIFIGPMMDPEEFGAALPEGIIKIAMPYPDLGIECHYHWAGLIEDHSPMVNPVARAPEDLVTLVYTSGTTGNPKGVMINGRNMSFAAEGMLKVMPAKGKERFFSYLPLAHAFERGAVELASLYFAAEVHFLEHIDKLAEQLAQVAPTRFFGVPLVLGRIQSGILKKLPQKKLDRLLKIPIVSGLIKKKIKTGIGLQNVRYLIVGAAPVPIPLMEWFAKLDIEILQGYGMTENNIYATANLPGANRYGSVGRAMPGANMRIASDGEIQFQHPAVMAGYYKDEEKTRETFTEDGWLRTGDRGRVDEQGYLYITGRVKDIFKTLKGKYVAPAPIEGAMGRNTLIDQLCLVGSELKQPILLVSLNDAGRAMSRDEAGSALVADMEEVNKPLEAHEKIAKVLIVKDVWTIDNGLMTPTMKVKRNEVEARYRTLLDTHAESRDKLAWE
jgi:long-chain acyl-CoA synthetase